MEPCLQVHDACYYEVPEDDAELFRDWHQEEIECVGRDLGYQIPILSGAKIGKRLSELEGT